MNHFSIEGISPVFIAWHDTAAVPHLRSDDSYGRRLVEHYELEYILSSRNGYILVNDIPVPTVPGSIFIRFPGMMAEGIGVYHSLFIEFDMNTEGTFLLGEEDLTSCPGNGTGCQADEELFYSLKPEREPTLAQLLQTKARILSILGRLAEQSTGQAEKKYEAAQLEKIRDALCHIRMHYADTITEAELASVTGYSVFYFCRLFKELTQLTPTQYIARYRAEKARTLLITTDDSMEVIMEKAGFQNYSYFWRRFRQIYGCSPSDYRKRFS